MFAAGGLSEILNKPQNSGKINKIEDLVSEDAIGAILSQLLTKLDRLSKNARSAIIM